MEESESSKVDALSWMLDNMPILAMINGLFLIIFGVFSYITTGQSSVTSLIPSFIGLGFLAPGYLAYSNPNMKMHAMHATALFALVGTLGGLMALPSIMEGDWSNSTIARFVLFFVCVDYMVLSIMSFRNARIKRK